MKPGDLAAIRADLDRAVAAGEITHREAERELAWAEADAYNEDRADRDD